MKIQTKKRIMFGILLMCALLIIIGLFAGKPNRKGLGELVGPDRIALISIVGQIVSEDSDNVWFSQRASSGHIIQQLKRVAADRSVKALVLRINSPGGSTVASQEIYAEIVKLRSSGCPVFVSMAESAASGGYYISVPADYIFANPSTITGSIGVIMEIQDMSDIYDKIGIKHEVIKSGEYKDIGSPYREISNSEQEILQALVDDTYEQFIGAVAEGRGMSVEAVREIADGRIYTGRQALDLGLVDRLGTLEDTLDYARKVTGLGPNAPVVEFKEKKSIMSSFLNIVTSSLELGVPTGLVDPLFSGVRLLFMHDSGMAFNMIF